MKNELEDLKIQTDKFNGIYRGVIEDRNDPDKRGRCRIRIFGLHTEKKNKEKFEGIPTEELPWADPALSLFEGSISGLGFWTVPQQGSHVFLFFENGNHMNPKYFASAPGFPTELADQTKGFNDPSGALPRKERLNQPDFHKLARGETSETLVQNKNSRVEKGVVKAGGGTWNEPQSAYAAKYPDNIILVTKSGITIEMDSTQGAERFHIYHPSNSYLEIDKSGNLVCKNTGNTFEITLKEKNELIKANRSLTVNGNNLEKVKGNETKEIDGKHDLTIKKSSKITINSTCDITVNSNCTLKCSANVKVEANGIVEVKGAQIRLN